MVKNKEIEQLKVPKAYVIKIEDTISKNLYSHLLEQNTFNLNQSEISTWYSSNREHCVLYLRKLCDLFQLRENTFFFCFMLC